MLKKYMANVTGGRKESDLRDEPQRKKMDVERQLAIRKYVSVVEMKPARMSSSITFDTGMNTSVKQPCHLTCGPK